MRAVLDACILYPTILRLILLGAARVGGLQPLWSAPILEEWRRVAARAGPEAEAEARGAIAALRAEWPHAEVPVGPRMTMSAASRSARPGAGPVTAAGADVAPASGAGQAAGGFYPGPDGFSALPDPGDEHVLAAAIAGRADVILTRNLRDFPPRVLAPLGLRALHPDPVLLAVWRERPAEMGQVVAEVHAGWVKATGGGLGPRGLLKRAGLPRLGKAVETAARQTPGAAP